MPDSTNSILTARCRDRLAAQVHEGQVAALRAKILALEQEVHVERVGRLLAERRLAEASQGVPSRYTRNTPDDWPRNTHKRGFE